MFATAVFTARMCVAQNAAPARSPSAQAQSAPARDASRAAPRFDVAAIHLHNPEPHEHSSIWSSPSDSHFRATNVSLVMLIHWAFEMPETRILSAPSWARTTMFNLEAEADPSVDAQLKGLSSDAGRAVKEKMIQALLADRFNLATHTETRVLPIYALVVAKGGPILGTTKEEGTTVNTGHGHFEVEASNSIAVLAEELSKVVGRDVVDQTGISGRYDLKLQWVPDDIEGTLLNGQPVTGPSIFTALQEQLGLKLEPQKSPVQVLVIDRVDMPTEN